MKETLLQLYKNNLSEFKKVVFEFPHDDLAGPCLMSPCAEYAMQPHPLLVVGQETNGWSCFINDPEKQMGTYEDFNAGYGQTNMALWSTVRKVESALGQEPHSCAWTNISKFDLYGGRSHGKYEKAIARLDKLLLSEIQITMPKVCLFFTGPHFDNRLSKVFNGLEFEPVSGWHPKQLCRLKHAGLPAASYRSYHPRFLRLKCLEQNFIDFISQQVTVFDNLAHTHKPDLSYL